MVHKHRHIFTKLFFLMTGMISLLTILALIIGTFAIRNFIKGSTLESTREKLAQKQYLLEHTLDNIERTAFSLAQDNNFHRFVLLPENVNERYPVWKDIVDKMNDTMISFDFIDSIYLYPFEKDRDILSNKGVISRKDFSDRLYISRLTNKSYNKWQQTRSYAHATLSPLTEDPTVMSYIKTVPAQDSMPRGLLVINIRVDSINEILLPVSRSDRVLLLNREGIVLVDSLNRGTGNLFEDYKFLPWDRKGKDYREQKGERGTDLIISRESKKFEGMYFYFANAPFKDPWILFLKGLVMLTGLFIMIGIIIAYFISCRYTKPWENLLEEFVPREEEDEFKALSGTIHELKDENKHFKDEEEKNNGGYFKDISGRFMVALEDRIERWKTGITLWESEEFNLRTNDLLQEIETSHSLDSYKNLLIHEMTRFIGLTIYRRAGNTQDLFKEDILYVIKKRKSFAEKKKYFLSIADTCKKYLDRNVSRPREELVKNLLIYMDDHFREEIYTESMAGKLNLSESYFCKIVKDITGKSFNELLSERRFREVCRLLKETDESLDGIAQLSGLKSKRNLLRNFKKYCDDTPGQYRQKARLGQ
jgi:AraC-like DNA-binding protein